MSYNIPAVDVLVLVIVPWLYVNTRGKGGKGHTRTLGAAFAILLYIQNYLQIPKITTVGLSNGVAMGRGRGGRQ